MEGADPGQARAGSWVREGGAPPSLGHSGVLVRTSVSRAGRISLTAILRNARTEHRILQMSLT